MKFSEFRKKIEKTILEAYENTPTMDEAERTAAFFLDARLVVGEQLRQTSLDARMKRTGLKATKAETLLSIIAEATKGDGKKPTESVLGALVDADDNVRKAQEDFDRADVDAADLQNLLEVTKESHIYFRGLSKGRMD